MKAFEKIIKIIFDIFILFLILIVIVVAYNFIQINILKKQYTDFFGYSFFEVTTGSMSGTIEINDVIAVKITKEVEKGDIVTYEKENEIITHRIIEISNEKIYTKGDANTGEDLPIEKQNVIGKVIKIFPKSGVWIKVFSDFKVISPILITIILFGMAVTNKEKEKPKEKYSFSKFMRKRRVRRNGKRKKKAES